MHNKLRDCHAPRASMAKHTASHGVKPRKMRAKLKNHGSRSSGIRWSATSSISKKACLPMKLCTPNKLSNNQPLPTMYRSNFITVTMADSLTTLLCAWLICPNKPFLLTSPEWYSWVLNQGYHQNHADNPFSCLPSLTFEYDAGSPLSKFSLTLVELILKDFHPFKYPWHSCQFQDNSSCQS